METILPETDNIKKAVDSLHKIQAHQLAQKRLEDLNNQSKPIKVEN